jgi:hypothetical protein
LRPRHDRGGEKRVILCCACRPQRH